MYDKYVWNESCSLDKLTTAMSNPDFTSLKNKILRTDYSSSKIGCNKLNDDVQKLTKFLHEKCCDMKRLGKK